MLTFLCSIFIVLYIKVKFKRVLGQNTISMQKGSRPFSTSPSGYHAHDDIGKDLSNENNIIGDVVECQINVETETRLGSAVDKLLREFNWTLAPLAEK